MKTQVIVFLSMMTSIYFIAKIIPLSIGEPIYVFFGVLFSYFAGSICIAYIYVLNTLDLIINMPSLLAIGESSRDAMAALTSNSVFVPDVFCL